jgi:hypothetical protein
VGAPGWGVGGAVLFQCDVKVPQFSPGNSDLLGQRLKLGIGSISIGRAPLSIRPRRTVSVMLELPSTTWLLAVV